MNLVGFSIRTDLFNIRFEYYMDVAPKTCEAFATCLPLAIIFYHARVSGQEIWTENSPKLDVPQENSSVFAKPGEMAIGPIHPSRNKVAGLMGIFYGDGKLVDGSNIFAKAIDEDLPSLKALGETIWKQGAMEIKFEQS